MKRRVSLNTALLLSLVLLLVLALTGCAPTIVSAPAEDQLGTVSASGTGTASATPDEATMSFGVTKQSKDAKAALDAASKTAEDIGAAVKKAGVDDKDIQTQNVSVFPITGQDGSDITGYQATLSVTVKVRELGDLSEVIAAATNAGADTVSGPTFGVADDTEYRGQAIDKAVADARKSAEAMAKAAGKSVGEVVRISSLEPPFGPMPLGAAESSAKDVVASVPIEPGQLDITANVTVVFELK